jgi:hypothetical protein
VQTDRVAAFVESAAEFCSFVESASGTPTDDFCRAAERRLIELYLRAIELPHVEPLHANATDARAGRPPGWPGFGDREIYWMLFDASQPSEPVCGSLSDDFLDIYNDVKKGLVLWTADDRTEAIWHWRFNFEIHWGRHAVEAIRALRLANP